MLVPAFRRLALLVLLAPSAALALGLGNIHLQSALNAPLSANIDVLDASPTDLSSLKATLASPADFKRNGLSYPGFLGTVTAKLEQLPGGRAVIHLKSTSAADEPFAQLLIDVSWARGQLLRQYTVLFNPPVFTPGRSAPAAIAAPRAAGTAHVGNIQQSAAAAAPAAQPASSATAPSAAPAGSVAAAAAAGRVYLVKRGDTLSSIASQAYPGSDHARHEQELAALYQGNRSAFEGNMNVLLAGAHLQLPGEAELAQISPAQATSEVHQQYTAWLRSHPQAAGASGAGQLRLVTPSSPGAKPGAAAAGTSAAASAGAPGTPGGNGAGAGGPTSASAAALQQRVQQLESQLAASKRLVQLQNTQLAALQARLAQHPGTPAAAGAAPPAGLAAKPAAAKPPAPPQVASKAPAATAAATAPKPAAAPPAARPAATPHPAPVPAAAATAAHRSGSLLDLLDAYWYVPAVLAAVLLGLLAVRAMRARSEREFDRSLGRLSVPGDEVTAAPVEDQAADAPHLTDTIPVRALESTQDAPYRVEESGNRERPRFEQLDRSAVTGEHVPIDESVTTQAPVALDQGDPLAEADFHMAYGLYDQAADLVQIAISREPTRRDLKLKLLEIFFVWGNKDRFLQSARELADTRERALPGEWEKIVIMGRQIAPDDPLFAQDATLSQAVTAGVDLNLEGGQNQVDFELDSTLQAASAGGGGGDGVDLDLGAALGEDEPTGEARVANGPEADSQVGGTGLDFVLDDPQRGNDTTGSTREMPGPAGGPGSTGSSSGDSVTVQVLGADPDAPTVEQPQLHAGDSPTIRQKLDAASRSGMPADQTAELAIDDLGLDMGSLEGHGGERGDAGEGADGDDANAPTLLADVDQETREMLARTDLERDELSQTARTSVDRALMEQAEREGSGDAAGTPDGADSDAAEVTGEAQPSDHAPREAAGSTSSGTWLFSDSDLDAIVAHGKTAQEDGSSAAPTMRSTQVVGPDADRVGSTSLVQALDASEVDVDLGAFAKNGNGSTAEGTLDLDIGAPGSMAGQEPTTREARQIREEANGERVPELEPVTMSEVGTKLDLARAYMDMGDPDGARSILQEVLHEGSVAQKQEARRLIEALPG